MKVYNVEFMSYTNCMHDTVSKKPGDIHNNEYLNVGREGFLVREDELEKYRQYGGGFRSVTFVGNMVDNKE